MFLSLCRPLSSYVHFCLWAPLLQHAASRQFIRFFRNYTILLCRPVTPGDGATPTAGTNVSHRWGGTLTFLEKKRVLRGLYLALLDSAIVGQSLL